MPLPLSFISSCTPPSPLPPLPLSPSPRVNFRFFSGGGAKIHGKGSGNSREGERKLTGGGGREEIHGEPCPLSRRTLPPITANPALCHGEPCAQSRRTRARFEPPPFTNTLRTNHSCVPQGDHPFPSPFATREQVASSSAPLVPPARFEPPSLQPSPAGHT